MFGARQGRGRPLRDTSWSRLRLSYSRGYGLTAPAEFCFVHECSVKTLGSAASGVAYDGSEKWNKLLRSALHAALTGAGSAAGSAARSSVPAKKGDRVLLLNAGLWDAAYGSVAGFAAAVGPFLRMARRAAAEAGFNRLLWMTSPSVHPVVYGDLERDQTKHAFTSPRVQLINWLARDAVMRERTQPLGGPTDVQIDLVDVWPLSAAREDDPLTPSDMRHVGASTTGAMAQRVLRAVCGDNFGSHEQRP